MKVHCVSSLVFLGCVLASLWEGPSARRLPARMSCLRKINESQCFLSFHVIKQSYHQAVMPYCQAINHTRRRIVGLRGLVLGIIQIVCFVLQCVINTSRQDSRSLFGVTTDKAMPIYRGSGFYHRIDKYLQVA